MTAPRLGTCRTLQFKNTTAVHLARRRLGALADLQHAETNTRRKCTTMLLQHAETSSNAPLQDEPDTYRLASKHSKRTCIGRR